MNAIAHNALEEKRLRLILKGAFRVLLKAKLTDVAHEQFGPVGGILANVFSAASESADTRCWTLLPAAFYVSRLKLKPGKHKVTIQGRALEYEFRPGEILLLRDKG